MYMGRQKTIVICYAIWAFAVFALAFWAGGWSPDNITHILILLFFLAQLMAFPSISHLMGRLSPRVSFILSGVVFAAAVEGAYMISKPVFASLRVTSGMDIWKMTSNYAADLAYTLPAYVCIFAVIWHLIGRYEYAPAEYLLLFGFGQAVGDGGAYFIASPHMLLFLPYVMLNYHAMNLVPYLAVRRGLKPKKGGIMRIVYPPVLLFAVYWICGALIIMVGRLFGMG